MDKDKKMLVLFVLLAGVCSLVSCGVWKASVVQRMEALVSSCAVVPCSFSHPGGELPSSRLRGIWHRSADKKQIIYHEDASKILDSFKERTKLLGRLGQNNCTLEITQVKDHDNGPFCFRIELVKTDDNNPTTDMFSFVESCVGFSMLHEPPKPKLGSSKMAKTGKAYTVPCSVRHTCSSHMPKLTWNKGTRDEITEIHKELSLGVWETESILTFFPQDSDDGTELTCTAAFHGGVQSQTSLTLNVKQTLNHNHIIIPVVVAVGTALVFGGLCIFMMKKYKTRIAELQNQDGSMWNRMSRMSRRLRSGGRTTAGGPSQSEQRRPPRDNRDTGYCKNNAHGEQKLNKPRLPSPKSQQKSYDYNKDNDDDDYMNTADLSIYGNV
ncbi:myelin-associated glycoprotein [Austrofundulus limnaeus]|uniref:Myelin-associated glycoprotein n=1 Tax=Austrofundulus limnaeus TaxID=52670 RepID=A0A2I4B8T3_AUSLI|nr:PREDICTED: myelin-associated glycoprotein-like [Austrofundulus limnaeus]